MPRTSKVADGCKGHDEEHVAPGLWRLRVLFVNVYLAGDPASQDAPWVLVDAGLPYSAPQILEIAEHLFGRTRRPAAIVLTHGHFDHVGALKTLAEQWDVPVYAHPLEAPYLTGRSAYPPPDPTVDGGAMARLSVLYPKGPVDLGPRVRPLPEDGAVPGMPGWRWVHTPGHTPGHVSLFREEDAVLLAGDAFVTVQQESALAVLRQEPEVHGPPAYFTPDWPSARRSVERLARLQPTIVATGHGVPMQGERMRQALDALARDFDRLAVPTRGRYVGHPARADERGTTFVPAPQTSRFAVVAVAGLAATALALLWKTTTRRR